MKPILYIWKSEYPWDVRVEKVCKALQQYGYNVNILARAKDEISEYEEIDGLHIHRVGFRKNRMLSLPIPNNPVWKKAIKKAIEDIQPSLIIVREIMLAELASKLAKKHSIPIIMDMAEHYPAAMRGWKKYMDNFFLRFIVKTLKIPDIVEKRAVRSMDGIIFVSPELGRRIQNKYNYDLKNSTIINNTPEISWFNDISVGLADKPYRFAYHGHMTQDRNLYLMVKAFIIAAQSDSDITLYIAGDGETYEECKALADSSNVSNRITFHGAFDHSEIKKLYSKMDFGILPFKNNEFINHIVANKLFDYMAAGKPVIVSEAIPMKRIINETGAGICVDCNDAENLAQAMLSIRNSNPKQMSDLGCRAFEYKYNWEVDKVHLLDFVRQYIK